MSVHQACIALKDGTALPESSFVRSRFHDICQKLSRCFQTILSHVPKSVILEKNYNNIILLTTMLENFRKLLSKNSAAGDEVLVGIFMKEKKPDGSDGGVVHSDLVRNLRQSMTQILGVISTLLRGLQLPATTSPFKIKKFCLRSASLIFCTVSGSAKLYEQKMDLLLIDEAAQLKECESLIPLQVSGLKHAVLIGDECQLPATVKSKVHSVLLKFLCPFVHELLLLSCGLHICLYHCTPVCRLLIFILSNLISCRLQMVPYWEGACLKG